MKPVSVRRFPIFAVFASLLIAHLASGCSSAGLLGGPRPLVLAPIDIVPVAEAPTVQPTGIAADETDEPSLTRASAAVAALESPSSRTQ